MASSAFRPHTELTVINLSLALLGFLIYLAHLLQDVWEIIKFSLVWRPQQGLTLVGNVYPVLVRM